MPAGCLQEVQELALLGQLPVGQVLERPGLWEQLPVGQVLLPVEPQLVVLRERVRRTVRG